MMKNLVYSRRATKRVPTIAKMLIMAAVCCARGSIVILAVVLTSDQTINLNGSREKTGRRSVKWVVHAAKE
jgi:hypothetical protein